jgi:hypothetical protein
MLENIALLYIKCRVGKSLSVLSVQDHVYLLLVTSDSRLVGTNRRGERCVGIWSTIILLCSPKLCSTEIIGDCWQEISLILVIQVNKPTKRSQLAAARRNLGLFN